MKAATRNPQHKSTFGWVKGGQTIRISMWSFPVPKARGGQAEEWFGEGTAFDSPEDLVNALQSIPEAAGLPKSKRRNRRRALMGERLAEPKSRSRLRALIFAALIVMIPIFATQVTSHNAVTADLHVQHAISHAATFIAPGTTNNATPPANAPDANLAASTGPANTTGAGAAVSQASGASAGTGTQPTKAPPGASTPTPPPAAPVNLLSNPSFESNGNGWTSPDGALYRCSNCGAAEDGKWVMQVNPNYHPVGSTYSIESSPGYSGTVGHSYTASMWVRAYNATADGATVTMGVHEQTAGGTVVQTITTSTRLSLTWQSITVTVTQQDAGDQLVMYVSQVSRVLQESFLVDEASLTAS